ncbi:eukaryotic porin/Tom40 [Mycotypha africana]|uniref:eukaryotic porin/Tom40 n=1 Tax=Mycotypha africana TaxID=64632 RepID=UPI002301706E|nr:eukaryotic porin/Tom40 [Mycotypha africana]KAI8991405.1 eukaryotic porin/Tom40 [Mycotypha africana]
MSFSVSYNDIGKSARNLLLRDFPIGGVKLDVKTTAPNGVAFRINGQRDNRTGIIIGDLETKYMDRKTGFAITESWTTSNQINGKIELNNNLAKGLKIEFLTSLIPNAKEKAAKLNVTYRQASVLTAINYDVFKNVMSVNSTSNRGGFVVGAEAAYNVRDAKIHRYNAAVGYSTNEYAIAINSANNMSQFAVSYYHRVNGDLEASGKAVWSKTTMNGVALEVGARMRLDKTSFIKGKVTNSGIVGASYTQQVRPGVKINFGAAIDTNRLNENGHKVGMALTFEN